MLLATLRAHHARIRECASHHDELCRVAKPDSGRVVLSRLRLLNMNADRSRFLAREVLPALQVSTSPSAREVVAHLAADLATRQNTLKAHIERWDAGSIDRDWSVYQQAALRILAAVEERLQIEADALVPLLSRLDKPC